MGVAFQIHLQEKKRSLPVVLALEHPILINTLLVVIIQRSRRADRIYEVEIIE